MLFPYLKSLSLPTKIPSSESDTHLALIKEIYGQGPKQEFSDSFLTKIRDDQTAKIPVADFLTQVLAKIDAILAERLNLGAKYQQIATVPMTPLSSIEEGSEDSEDKVNIQVNLKWDKNKRENTEKKPKKGTKAYKGKKAFKPKKKEAPSSEKKELKDLKGKPFSLICQLNGLKRG